MNRKAIIFGIQKYKFTNKEKSLFRKTKPWGIILFSRNIKDIFQLKILSASTHYLLPFTEGLMED